MMIYLNQAATSYPKPQAVLDAHAAALKRPPAGQFRSGDGGQNSDIQEECRRTLAPLLGVKKERAIYFTSGATHSLNAVLNGLDFISTDGTAGRGGIKNGDGRKRPHILATATEHNSVLRPLYNLPRLKGCDVEIVPCDRYGRVWPEEIRKRITPRTGMIAVNHCSNVTGMVQDMEEIGKIAQESQILFLADVSQSAGCLLVEGDRWQTDILIFTGHKSLLGVQGCGGHYVRPGIRLRPFIYGGTGRDSSILVYDEGEYEYDAGTQNVPGLAALQAGAEYIREQTLEQIMRRERRLMGMMYDLLGEISQVTLYGEKETNQGPVLSFNVRGLDPADVAYILQNADGIVVRTGLHCAPLIHPLLGSGDKGTVRVSVSCFNTEEEIRILAEAVGKLAASTGGGSA